MAEKNIKKKKSPFKIIIGFFCLLLAFILVTVPLTIAAFMFFNSPLRTDQMPFVLLEQDGIRRAEAGHYYVEVRRGETSQSVGRRLERAGLIRNRYFWNLLGRVEKEHIKSGTYLVDVPMSQIAIMRLLISGKQTLHRVTIKEGLTVRKMAKVFEDAGICSAQDFIASSKDTQIINLYNIPNNSMEGYLFPDTYFFPSGYPAEDVIKAMADNFFKRLETIDPSIITMSQNELNEKVIVASIIEREYRIAEEASLMAGVFYNRLRINMGLQSCATVEYIITEIQGKPHPRVITAEDLEIRNPYNTYMWAGLPPGPISSPGELALRAAFFPERTEYFYFRLEDAATGRHYFSRTNDEHIRAGRLIPRGDL